MAGNLHRIDRHQPKIGLNPNFLGYSNSPWTGTNMHTGFYGFHNFWWKVPLLPKSRNAKPKKENTEKNCFCVVMHFRTNRFTSKKILPPPPEVNWRRRYTLHSSVSQRVASDAEWVWQNKRVAVFCSVLQRIAACCIVLQRVAACCSIYIYLGICVCVYTYAYMYEYM